MDAMTLITPGRGGDIVVQRLNRESPFGSYSVAGHRRGMLLGIVLMMRVTVNPQKLS
jgi:hypothetical protein